MTDSNKLDLYLALILDKGAQQDFVGGIIAMEAALENLSEVEFEELTQKMYELAEATAEFDERIADIEEKAEIFNSFAARTSVLSSTFAQLAAAGTALFGGIFAGAAKYVKDAEEATETTKQWKDAMGFIDKQTNRIGKVLAEEALPYLKQAANLAKTVADFVTAHPELVKAAMFVGGAAAIIGAVTSTTLKAISAFARIAGGLTLAQASAAKIMDRAADKMLVAGGIMGKSGIGKAAGGWLKGAAATLTGGAGLGALTLGGVSLMGLIGMVLQAIGLVGAGATLGLIGYDQIQRRVDPEGEKIAPLGNLITGGAYMVRYGAGVAFREDDAEQQAINFAAFVGKFIGVLDETSPLVQKATDRFEELNKELERAAAAEAKTASIDVLVDLQKDLNQIDKQYAEERAQILEEAASRIASASQRYNQALANLREQLAETLSSLRKSFELGEARAAEDYQRNRAQIIADQEERIYQIRKQAQERLEELEYQHGLRMQDLVAARDALGIVREKERYRREQQKIKEGVRDEIEELRRNTAARLRELDRQYALEKQRRLEDYQRRVAEAKEQAAKRAEQLKIAHEQELAAIEAAKEEQLKELEKAHAKERSARIQAAYDQLKDLMGNLYAERLLRYKYGEAILGDTAQWVEDMKAYFSDLYDQIKPPPEGGYSYDTEGETPTRQAGGYAAGTMPHLLHQGEFVMNRETTQAAERLVGHRLSQGDVLGIMGGGRQLVYNDNRTITAELNERQVRELANQTIEVLEEAL